MARTRVYELAKLLGVESSRVLEILNALGTPAQNHMSTISDENARAVRATITRQALLTHQQRAVRQPAGPRLQKATTVAPRARPAEPAPLPLVRRAQPVARPAQGLPPPAPDVAAEPGPGVARAVPAVTAPAPSAPPAAAPTVALAADQASRGEAAVGPTQAVAPARRMRGPREAGAVPGPRPRVPSQAGPGYQRPGRPAGEPLGGRREGREAVGADRGPGRPSRPGTGGPGAGRGGPGRGRPAAGRPFRGGAAPGRGRGGGTAGATAARPRRRPARRRPQEQAVQGDARLGQAPRRKVFIDSPLTVRELADKVGVSIAAAVKQLMQMGVMATVNQALDVDIARRLAAELGSELAEAPAAPAEPAATKPVPREKAEKGTRFLRPRPPVVTVMGHVDHGKTTLLDTIRRTRVAAHEAGGITQHIGASVVNWKDHQIVFIDTPGHEAFTAMRARGAQVTDLVVLVVAADDGVKPQTLEAISHIRAAKVPMIVAVNKIDRPGADPEKVRRQLSDQGVTSEEWGGDTVFVNVSALEGTGIDTLLEMIVLVSDMLELRANPVRPAGGTVVEGKLDRGRGPVATVLVQAGTLRVGDILAAGPVVGRVRALFDNLGRRIEQAGPSQPVEVLGLDDVPAAGDPFEVSTDEHAAREKANKLADERHGEHAGRSVLSLEDLYKGIRAGKVKELNVVLKADVQGSLEALRGALASLELPQVRLSILHGGVGTISETDVMLAAASDAVVIGYAVRPDANARRVAQQERVDIRTYDIIYEILDDITAAAKGLLEPKTERVLAGRAQVRATFKVPKVGVIAGCYVTEGRMTRNAEAKVIRAGKVIHEGKVDSLKRFKDDAREVQAGFECGLGISGFEDYAEGDTVEVYVVQRVEAPA